MGSRRPRIPVDPAAPLNHREATWLAATEYDRLVELLASLDPDQWGRATECPPWDVRDMTTHLLGYMRACASMREQLRQVRAARRRGGRLADAMAATQVEELATLRPEEILAEIRAVRGAAVRGRMRVPTLVRRWGRVTVELPVSGARERWTAGYLIDVIGTRDGWMHRIDICRATGRKLRLTAEHDGRLVADIVADWARRHGKPFHLVLTGPAGGTFTAGPAASAAAEELEWDAVEFCRALSGRCEQVPFGTEVPF